jgi:DNA-binding transcriptional LysR family regulator
MELTPEGEVFLENAISVFEIIREMRSKTSKSYLEAQGKVAIAATHAIIQHFLPQFIVRFRKKSPMVVFELEGGGVEMILQRVESAEADFGIASLHEVPDGIVCHDLFETRVKLLAPKNSALFSKKEPTLKQIAEAPFLFFPHYSTITSLIMKVFSERDLALNVVMVLNNFESVKKYVELGMGVSILDEYTLTEKDQDKMEIYPLDRYLGRRKYGLILRKQKYLSPPAKAFIRSIKPAIRIK